MALRAERAWELYVKMIGSTSPNFDEPWTQLAMDAFEAADIFIAEEASRESP